MKNKNDNALEFFNDRAIGRTPRKGNLVHNLQSRTKKRYVLGDTEVLIVVAVNNRAACSPQLITNDAKKNETP